MKRSATFLSTLMTAALLSSCAGTKDTMAAQPAVNTTCPMCSKAVDTSCCASFEGSTVAFCSTSCCTEWSKLSDSARRTRLDAVVHKRN